MHGFAVALAGILGYPGPMSLAEQVRWAGVVGAGGAGFPTHVKLQGRADTVIANGAECEPLLHKDAAVMERLAGEVVQGVRLTMDAVGATRGVVAIKAKNRHAVDSVTAASRDTGIEVVLLGDYYPAGDEYDLVHTVTGRLIPPAGIPLAVGCVVNNVETLVNVARAAAGIPVTHKAVTIAGAVNAPVTLWVPLGTPLSACLAAAGGVLVEDPVLFLGGMMMGSVTRDLESPVTKTSTGAVVLSAGHPAARRRLTPPRTQAAIGKSACDQCRYCTEYCPRYLLGYAVEPHQVMRSLGFTATGSARWNEWAALCCSCGLCTLYACPEDLFPAEACQDAKVELRGRGWKWSGPREVQPHQMREGRRVPIRSLMKRLGIRSYDVETPWRDLDVGLDRLRLPLSQHTGQACRAAVSAGQEVARGQVIADVPEGALGARLHSPVAARVVAVEDAWITLEPKP